VRTLKLYGQRQTRQNRSYETISLSEPRPNLLLVTLNRPDRRNALNTQMGRDLRDIFVPLKFTPGTIRALVITGAGDLAFCAGGDLKERNGMSDETWASQHAIFEEAFYAVMECPIPVIAAVRGAAFGGGCELALACDFIYAEVGARFALTEVSLGIMPGGGGTQNLARAVGERRAKELILSARPFSAEDALRWGMVNEVCRPETLMQRVFETAERILSNAPVSVAQAKAAIHYGLQTDLRTGLMIEVQAYQKMVPTEDRREGMAAFNEKRRPRFVGR
jgi:enoyl-CoA hydratase